jgi:hypothetical protein
MSSTMQRHGRLVLSLTVLSLATLAGCARESAPKLSFNDSIQPILSENCYGCHGPDSSSRKAGLRLDRAEAAYAPHGEFEAAIIPGDADASPLIRRIEAADASERMPPPEAHKTLQPGQIALLRQWVEEGAKYEPHWSFITPQRPALPKVADADGWARNEIDAFVLARLQKENLPPSHEADRRTLIRRVTYDLTGLPPTPEEVDAFVADTAPDAYEKVVDRLLGSERYGEHRAHYWLDYIRYADTHGLHFDNYRSIWPYRDYVVQAYNQNLPFDRFVREQLAGDLLPEQTSASLIATGYIRSNVTTDEGGTILEEVQVNLARERVETFGVTFLGLTTGCAVCHDHKFDPLTQKDLYRLAAFLNNTADASLDFNTNDPPPSIRLPDEENRAAYDQVLGERAKLLARLAERRKAAPEQLRARSSTGGGPSSVSTDKLELRLRFDEGKGDLIRNSAPGAAIAQFKSEVAPIRWGETSWLWPSARFDASTRLPLGRTGDVEADEAFSVGGWAMVRGYSHISAQGALVSRLGTAGGPARGWEIVYQQTGSPIGLDNGYPWGHLYVNVASDAAAQPAKAAKKSDAAFVPMRRAIQVKTRARLTAEEWVHVLVTYDGSRKAAGIRIYLNGVLAETQVLNDSLQPGDSIRTPVGMQLASRGDDTGRLPETRYQDLRFYRRALSPDEVARLPYEDYATEILERKPDPAQWTSDERFVLADRYFAGQADTQSRDIRASLQALQTKIDALAPPPRRDYKTHDESPFAVVNKDSAAKELRVLLAERPSSLIAQEKPTPAYAHVLKRGDYASRLERVEPGTPDFLPPLNAAAGADRLALANWLLTAENPLFSRVAVNRMWQELFGTGLVKTAGDLGITGERPSHPELLDWLAVEFRESSWNVKQMYRRLVLSATYRQAAGVTPQLLQVDPANRLLARGPRFRMDAEQLRDSALAVSGLLVEKTGGPPVLTYQPPGIWQEVAMLGSNTREHVSESGEGLYRRTLYSFWKRASPPPSLETFDAPSRESACPVRTRGNTPLQALVTLNDPQFVTAAGVLAGRVLKSAADDDARIDALARLTLSRPLDPEEKAIVGRSLQTFTERFEAQPSAARELLAAQLTPADRVSAELAAWTLVASQFLNLDEFLTK